MGMMAGVGGTVGATVGGMMQNTLGDVMQGAAAQPPAPAPAQPPQPAAPPAADSGMADFEQRLKKLELLKGKIPDALYDAKLQEIMDSI
jgi:hypothetical protein